MSSLRSTLLRSSLFSSKRCLLRTATSSTRLAARPFSSAPVTRKDELPPNIPPGEFARTDHSITVEYPEENELPPGKPVILKGKGGKHYRRTLGKFSLEGKTALVTGAARGLGYVMAQGIIESGASGVAIVDLNGEEATNASKGLLKHFRDEVADEGDEEPTVSSHRCDVSNPNAVEDTFQEVLQKHGNKVDIVITSAGFTENFPAHEYPFDRMQKLWGVNVNGTYNCSVTAARHWIAAKQPGNIIMIGSMSGVVVNVPQPQAPYNAAKAAVRQLAASMAVEWATHGIRVNCISPGYMLTALTQKILDDNPELKRQWLSLIPQGRMGSPEDLMGAVVYLASDASRYVTGSDMRVDGGYTVA